MKMIEIKHHLRSDSNFRNLFPEYQEEIRSFLKDTSCPCHADLYRKIEKHQDRIDQYKDGKIVKSSVADEFKVINTGIEDLEGHLKKMPFGSKVESLARFGSDVTVIVRIPRQG